jgi:Type I phosphodiesterase / nucleotide pyrophosphatase
MSSVETSDISREPTAGARIAFDPLLPTELRDVPSLAELGDVVSAVAGRRAGSVILLAVDGVSLRIAEGLWRCDHLVRLRSVVPTTSTTAWLTALTGAGVQEHLVPGLVFKPDDESELVNVAEIKPGDDGATALIPAIPTIFERIEKTGVSSIACLGGLTAYPGPWRESMLRGCKQLPSRRFPTLRAEAMLAASAAIADVEDALRQSPADSLVFAYIDLDTAVHRYGYNHDVLAGLSAIDTAARRWSKAGTSVIAVSDHGLVPVSPSSDALAIWGRLETGPLCASPAGGAGRMRWLYATPGKENELVGQARSELQEWAEIVDARELHLDPQLRMRIGSAIAIARDPGFPLPPGHRSWDHGATTEEELLVPLAYWGEGHPRLSHMLGDFGHGG